MKMKPEEFIGDSVYYDNMGQIIFGQKKDGIQMILDVRGWGAIQNLFKKIGDAETFQDSVGEWLADAINKKLSGAEPEGKEAVELGLNEITTLARQHFDKICPGNGLQSLAERYSLEDMIVKAFWAAFDEFKIWKAEAK